MTILCPRVFFQLAGGGGPSSVYRPALNMQVLNRCWNRDLSSVSFVPLTASFPNIFGIVTTLMSFLAFVVDGIL